MELKELTEKTLISFRAKQERSKDGEIDRKKCL